MPQKTSILLAAVVVLVVGVAFPWRFVSFDKIETLQNPVAVDGWTPECLSLADGRTVHLPGLRSLPSQSAALTEATKRGVEVAPDGRVWGLVRVHHWCGNDRVREHIARVDLSEMMTFLRVGEPVASVPKAEPLPPQAGGTFSKSGWTIGEFLDFRAWQRIKSSNDKPGI